MKPKGAADGQQVNIPVPLLYRWLLKKDSGSLLRILRLKYSRWDERGKTRDLLNTKVRYEQILPNYSCFREKKSS